MRDRAAQDRCRFAFACVRGIAGTRHTGACDASQAPRPPRALSLRSQSDVRRSHSVDRRL